MARRKIQDWMFFPSILVCEFVVKSQYPDLHSVVEEGHSMPIIGVTEPRSMCRLENVIIPFPSGA